MWALRRFSLYKKQVEDDKIRYINIQQHNKQTDKQENNKERNNQKLLKVRKLSLLFQISRPSWNNLDSSL